MSDVDFVATPDIAPFTANGSAISESIFQALALNTQQNVVIEACAGSGKTWLLVARVLKLLLQGVQPEQIVAITFTRKAAQEMKQRLADMLDELHATAVTQGAALLSAMSMPDDAATRTAIEAAWQRCRALGEWPSIMTFHEWFGELRQNAPLSSLDNAGAALTEDEAALITQAWQQFWANTRDSAPLHDAMHAAVAHLGLSAFEGALNVMLARRAEWLVYTQFLQAQQSQDVSETSAQLAQAVYVAITAPESLPHLWTAMQGLMLRLKEVASQYLVSKTLSAIKRGDGLHAAFERCENLAQSPQIWQLQNAIKQLMEPISMADGSVVNTKTYKDMVSRIDAGFKGGTDGFVTEIEAIHAALQQLHHHCSLLRLLPVHQAVLECGSHLIDVYQTNKQAQRLIDFADLEIDAFNLLSQPRTEKDATVTTRHILLDEFQDTNPVQWQSLQAFVLPLLKEAAAGGQGASIFVVGDPKQSIYRFRRADPKLFTHVQQTLQADYGAVLLKTQRTRRNAQSVNHWVNAVFAPPTGEAGGLFSKQFTLSTSLGQIGVMPLLGEDELAQGRTEAEQVVQTLLAWKSRNPQLAWSQAMVLGRKRQVLAPIAAALQTLGIASVSADRGGFFALPEIADSINLLTALNNPADVLALLSALRSPIFGLTDEQLSELLVHHSTASTTHTSTTNAGEERWLGIAKLGSPWAKGVSGWLLSWQVLCSTVPMHDALDAMMHQAQWAQRFAVDSPERSSAIAANLAQLLQISLSVNQGRYPSLPRFVQAVATLRESDALAAQSTASSQAVRLSTIHGSKGLEADCVVIVGLYGKDKTPNQVKVLLDWPADQAHPSLFAMQLCSPTVLSAVAPLAAAHESELQASLLERDTLLYVAMTRAVSELWISATVKKNSNTVYERMVGAYTVAGLSEYSNFSAIHELPAPKAVPMISALKPTLPALASLPAPALAFVPPLRDPKQASSQALGVFMHSLLEYALRYSTWPSEIKLSSLATSAGLSQQEARTMLTRCQSMSHTIDLLSIAQQVDYLAIEEALYYQGEQRRPDLVAYQIKTKKAWVIDYKYSFDAGSKLANDYAQQLRGYASAIQAAGYIDVSSYIITLAGECWGLQDNQSLMWAIVAPPWGK